MAKKELRHFMTFQNGPHGFARVDFSDPDPMGDLALKITIDLEISTAHGNLWDKLLEDVQDMLKYAKKPSVNTPI
jgi:hypothetical protein